MMSVTLPLHYDNNGNENAKTVPGSEIHRSVRNTILSHVNYFSSLPSAIHLNLVSLKIVVKLQMSIGNSDHF